MLYEEHIHWQHGDVFTWDQINQNISWNIKSKTFSLSSLWLEQHIFQDYIFPIF